MERRLGFGMDVQVSYVTSLDKGFRAKKSLLTSGHT